MFTFETKKQEINISPFFGNFSTQSTENKYQFFNLKTELNNNISEYIKEISINIFKNFSIFKECFINENIHIKDEKELFTYFVNNNSLDINALKIFLKLIRDSFTKEREIIFNYDKKDIIFCIRQNDYNESNLNELISDIEDKIIDMLENSCQNAGFDISFYMDYKKPEF